MTVYTHLGLLGKKVKDSVTGFEGTVTSICFDLYGCIQALIHPGLNPEGKLAEQTWFDVNRLKVVNSTPCMLPPQYSETLTASGNKGPAEKPSAAKA
jgi:hypothetical protein